MAVLTTTKVGPKFQVPIPQAVRQAAGLQGGDWLEAHAEPDGTIRLQRKRLGDDDPELEAALQEAEEDVKAGRVLGPFANARAAVRALKAFATGRQKHARPHQPKIRRRTR